MVDRRLTAVERFAWMVRGGLAVIGFGIGGGLGDYLGHVWGVIPPPH